MKPYYSRNGIVIYLADCREVLSEIDADVLVTDPPYGVDFKGKATKHTTKKQGGYTTGDNELGPGIVRLVLKKVERAAVFPGNRLLWKYPEPRDVGCVYCPSGAGIGPFGFVCFHPVLFYGSRRSNKLVPTSMQSFDTVQKLGHPCGKPLSWMKWVLGIVSSEGDTVLDPFMGSGTTLRAAVDLGRKAIGIDVEERYCEIAAKRIERATAIGDRRGFRCEV